MNIVFLQVLVGSFIVAVCSNLSVNLRETVFAAPTSDLGLI